MNPTTFSPCSATMAMQLRCRRQRRKSSSVQASSKLSCSVCKTSGMSRRIIQRICTRACSLSFSVRPAFILHNLPSPQSAKPPPWVRRAAALSSSAFWSASRRVGLTGTPRRASSRGASASRSSEPNLNNAPKSAQGQHLVRRLSVRGLPRFARQTTRERQGATASPCSSRGVGKELERGDSFPLLPAFQAVQSLKSRCKSVDPGKDIATFPRRSKEKLSKNLLLTFVTRSRSSFFRVPKSSEPPMQQHDAAPRNPHLLFM